jgi:CubicO group peptidase (beta-lactamase class C family)
MDWQRAAAEAGRIAQNWTREDGPGGAVILFDADDIRAEAAGGLASLDLGTPFRPDSAVRYASISKHFFASLVVRSGAMALDDALGAHLPLRHANAAVTVGRALDMTGGLADTMEVAAQLGVSSTATMDRDALLAFISDVRGLNFAPGAEISYSNTGYRLAQAALEAKGIDVAAELHARFFRPFGLGISFPVDETDAVANLATGYWRAKRGWLKGRYGPHISASGGLAGSGRDLAIWAQALLTGRDQAAGLLGQLGALRHLTDGRPTGYGLGLARASIGDRILIGHGGSLPGYKNNFLLDPESSAGVVVVSNREDTDAHGLALRVMAALHGADLPGSAAGMLPEGLFVAEDAPYWIEAKAGNVTFLGAQTTLHRGEDGWAESGSAHMPIRLRPTAGGIEGEIGHRAYRFAPAKGGTTKALDGLWSASTHHATLEISEGNFAIGTGPTRTASTLTPLTDTLALVTRGGPESPSSTRMALALEGNSLRLITNRARVLRFSR